MWGLGETNKAKKKKQKVKVKYLRLYCQLKECHFELVFLLIISMK